MFIINSGMKKYCERPKATKREYGVDYISKMPDAILILFLSRLSSTEEQIRTSILSRRWRYLWTAVPSVVTGFEYERKFKKSKYKEFVYWVLARKTVDLDIFRLSLNNYYSMPTIWRWVNLAVMRNVKQLYFSFPTKKETEVIELPRFLVSCGSLEVLRLDSMKSGLSRFAKFSALRVLELTEVVIPEDDDLLNSFLKGCPLLEDLSMVGCLIGKLVCILCPKLKRLCIINWDDVRTHDMKIFCPELADLKLGGRVLYGNSDDSVQFHGNSDFKWSHLYFSFEGIDAACDLALPHLKTLLLRTTMDAFTFKELIRILKFCPKLENLTLIIRKEFDEEYEWVDEAEARGTWTPDVKRVEFFEINGEKPILDIDCCESAYDIFFTFIW